MSDKIYCGSGKRIGTYGTVSISICLDDIPAEYKTKSKNGKVYVNLNVNEKREADQYGKTHSVTVDTWKPDAPKSAPTAQASYKPNLKQFEVNNDEPDGLPF
jgi:hypothetical protein